MRKNFLTLVMSVLVVFSLNAQKIDLIKTNNSADKVQKNYVMTGGDSHQSQWNAPKGVFFEDDLNGGNLDNFTVINGGDANGFEYNAENGIDGSGCVQIKYSSAAHDDWLITPQLAVVGGMKLTFWHKNRSTGTYAETYDIAISTTGTAATDFTTVLETAVKPPETDYTFYEVDLTAYAGQNIYVGFHNTTTDMFYLYFDNFKVTTPEEHDLAIASFDNVGLLFNSSTAFAPKVTVKNIGKNAEDTYSVNLTATKVGETTTLYDETLAGTSIAAFNGTVQYTFPDYTFTANDTIVFEATVTLATDADNDNDSLVSNQAVAIDFTGMAYGQVIFGGNGGGTSVAKGTYLFNPTTPDQMFQLAEPDGSDVFAGDCADSVWYVVGQDKKLSTLDFATGTRTEIATIDESCIEFAYDYSTEKMYGYFIGGTSTAPLYYFGTIDLTTGAITHIGEAVTLNYFGLACSADGIMFAIANDGNFYTVDKTTGVTTLVGATGVTDIKYVQSAGFDYVNNKLYWAQTGSSSADMYEVNTATGVATKIGTPANGCEISGFTYQFKLKKYATTFTVTDGTNPIDGVIIKVNGKQITTDASGVATIELQNGSFDYTAVKTAFANATGTVTVADAEQNVDISMAAGTAEWTVTFKVKDALGNVEGATITMDGQNATTDVVGMATLEHADATDLAFTVTKDGYVDGAGTVTIAGADVAADEITLLFTTHVLTFNVKKSWGTNEAIEGAAITIVQGDSTYNGTTLADGSMVFPPVLPGDYTYTVVADGYANGAGTVTLDADKTEEVLLDEAITDPYALNIVVTGTDAAFSWNNATGFFDNFDSYDNFVLQFSPWTLHDEDGLATYGFSGITFEHATDPMAAIIFNPTATNPVMTSSLAHSGDKYSATFNPSTGTKTCDDWIISPKTMVKSGDKINFWARGGNASYSVEKFQVFISTTDTEVASFSNITEVISCAANSAEWQEFTYDIPAEYAGKDIYVGLHITSTDQFYFCLDDFKIGNPVIDKGNRALQSYTVELDGAEVATGVMTTSHDFSGLSVGDHTAGVKAIYESGESATVTIDFTVAEPATAISLDQTTLSMNISDEVTLVATVDPAGADQSVTWTSSDEAIATVDANGKVTAVAYGTATITATSVANTALTATCAVTVSNGINDVANGAINVYPNPSNGVFNVDVNGTYDVQVIDATGRVIDNKEISGSTTYNLENGVYFFKFSNENNAPVSQKVIVK